jgi:hypothetical protein
MWEKKMMFTICVLALAIIMLGAALKFQTIENKNLKYLVESARKDTLHWYNRVHELEMANHTTNTDPCFTGTGHVPKDYEEQQI